MVFSSTVFLFIFLPVVYILYLCVPKIKAKNIFLIIASLIFYSFGEPFAVFLMIGSVFFSYLCGMGMEYQNKFRKLFVVFGITVNLGLLCVYKYAAFFVETFNNIMPVSIPIPNISLPIGISFFIFQTISYIIDVYREETQVQKNPFYLLLYVAFFPQLIAGPIIKYHDISSMILNRKITVEATSEGIRRFICGLAKKMMIANTMGAVADEVFEMESNLLSMPSAWLGAVCYTLQIYLDFSGYSDMAIGLGKMFGFDFRENFNYPYISNDITEFWRRWHISVSTWFKEYLYFSLGGNRKGKTRTMLNKWAVFLCTGFWHGANWTFLIWGIINGLFLMIEYYQWIPTKKFRNTPLSHIYTMFIVVCSFVVFRACNLGQAGNIYTAMFTDFNIDKSQLSAFTQFLSPMFIINFIVAVTASTPVLPYFRNKLKDNTLYPVANTSGYIISFMLLIICIMKLSVSSYNPFIYTKF